MLTSSGTKLTDNFKNIIQKKLDESALRILCSEYSKGANIKLKPQDVAFIQPKHRSPDHQVVLCIPQLLESYAQALAVYFMQLLGTFTIKPQYAPETSHFAVSEVAFWCTVYGIWKGLLI